MGKQIAAAPGRSLGSLGKDKGTVDDITFDWFGSTIRVNPGAGELELMQFLVTAEEIEVGDDDSLKANVPAMKAVFDFLRAQIHPDDWLLFFDLAKTHRQNTMDLMEVAMAIVTELSGFPTGPSDGSSPGTATTKRRSKGGSTSPAPGKPSLTRKALALVPAGRPDIAAAFVQAEEARAGR